MWRKKLQVWRATLAPFSTLITVGVVLVVATVLSWTMVSTTTVVNAPVVEDVAITTAFEVSGPILSESEPVRLRIPSINVDTPFTEPLGLDTYNEIEVPEGYEEVGWYKHGPTPGELGPAVVLGHVDSYEGPAVFFSLGQLKEGDDIYIDRADGSVAHFKVTVSERHEQIEFPTRQVYGDIDHAGLRLITCTGVFLHGAQRYTHNLIVYAKLVGAE